MDISEEDLKYALEGIAGMGQLSVKWQGSCRRPKWRVEWLTKPGDQPLIQVTYFHIIISYLHVIFNTQHFIAKVAAVAEVMVTI